MSPRSPLWGFVYNAFNRVDLQRLAQYGPDRTCAEWILRNGGKVSTRSAPGKYIADYNALPLAIARHQEPAQPFRLHSIVAENVGITADGFEHLNGCTCIEKIRLDGCEYVDNEALYKLRPIATCLADLELAAMPGITDEGVLALVRILPQLRRLTLKRMEGVEDIRRVLAKLEERAPQWRVAVE